MSHERAPVAIVGAGLAGLVAARELHRQSTPVVVYEASRNIAGLAKSFHDEEGFSHDVGAHFITNRLAAAVGVGARCRTVRHYAETVTLGGRSYSYPFGLMRAPRFLAGAVAAGRMRATHRPPESALEWFRAEYGTALADEVALPLVEAWSGTPAADLAPSVGDKIPSAFARTIWLKAAARLTGRAVARGYCGEQPESMHVWHVYPEGGVSTICDQLAGALGGVIHLESPVEAIIVEGGQVVGLRVNGRQQEVSAVLSTAPVHVLPKLVQGTTAVQHLARFRYRPMVFVNLRLVGRGLLPDVVTWTPEAEFPFFRLTEAPLSMPWLAPLGKTLITVDIGCSVGDETWTMADDQLGELCVRHLTPIVPDVRQRYLGCRVVRTPIAYPIFLREYERERIALQHTTGVGGLYSIGRNGEFAHILMEDVYWRTLRRAWQVISDLADPSKGRGADLAPAIAS